MQTVTRQINEITVEEAKALVAEHVERDGFEFVMLINKSAALFRRYNEFNKEVDWGLVLGQQDGIQIGDTLRFGFVLYREPTVVYDARLSLD